MAKMLSLGKLIDELGALEVQKDELSAKVKALDKIIIQKEEELTKRMDAEGVSKSLGLAAQATISESIVPSVQDWDLFYKYIKRTGYFQLLERRPATLAFRELFTLKGIVPGVIPFTKRKLTITPVNKGE